MTVTGSQATTAALDLFVQRYIDACLHARGELPRLDYDPDWPSACCQGEPDARGQVCWKPVLQRATPQVFAGLEQAFEQPIHPDLQAFYSRYWSEHLPATSPDGDLDLLMIWNEEDYERLRENLVGHAFSKFRRRQPLTLFFACPVSQGDYFISLDNQSGEILLEEPGRPPLRRLAPSMAAFLSALKPRL